MVFYNLSNTFPVFPALEKNDDKVFSKNIVTFRHNIAYMVNLFLSHFI